MTRVPLDHLEYDFVLVSYVGVCCYRCLLLFPSQSLAYLFHIKWTPRPFGFMRVNYSWPSGWLLDAQSSKKLKGQWKKASSLGMHLSAKYSEAHAPTFADTDIILPMVVFGKREEAAKTISDEKLRLLPSP